MSLHVLEFNDAGLRLADTSGILLSSPGYAYVNAKNIEFGESARKQSKVHPLNSFNQFWHKLSLDPFSKPVGHFRHNADIAFSHLQEITLQAKFEGDAVLAVPGSFSREQMAILLGLLKQSRIRPIGLVDAALMACIDQVESESVIHVDLQLHQVVLSKMQRDNGELKRDSVMLVPGAGWINISDSLMQLFTSAFIQQCRFNPQHNAASEQMLLDNLPQWLIEESHEDSADDASLQESRRSLHIKLSHNSTVHEVSLPRSALHNRLLPFFQKIQQQLDLIDPQGGSTLLFSDRMQNLPGVDTVLANSARKVQLLREETVTQACLRHQEALIGATDALHYIGKLSPKKLETPILDATTPETQLAPTHLLLKHRAHSVSAGLRICLANETDAAQSSLRLLRVSRENATSDMRIMGKFVFEQGEVFLQSEQLQINGKVAGPMQKLQLGDVIGAANVGETIELICVQDYDD